MVKIAIIFQDGTIIQVPVRCSPFCYKSDLKKFMQAVNLLIPAWDAAYFTVDNIAVYSIIKPEDL